MPQRGLAFTLPVASFFSPSRSADLPCYNVDVRPNFFQSPSSLIKGGIRAFDTGGRGRGG